MTLDWSCLPEWTNEVYKPLYKDWKRFNIIFGGSGSGKSVFIAQRLVYRICTADHHNVMILRKTGDTNRKSTFPLMQQVIGQWGLSEYFTFNKSDLTIKNSLTNSVVIFSGLDDVEKLKSVTFDSGPLTDVWIEEASEISHNDLTQVDLRLRGIAKQPFQIILSFNPISHLHWIKEELIDKPTNDMTVLKTTYLDNRFLDDGYKARLNALSGQLHRVYALGEWGTQEGVIFDAWDIQDVPAQVKLLGYGLDWGYSSDPAAMIAIYKNGDDVWLDERIYQTGLTNADLIALLPTVGVQKNDEIIADSAEPKSIEDLFRAGYNIKPCVKGPDSVRFGINVMKSFKLHVTERSVNLQREMYSYSWKINRDGKALPDPVDDYNHGIDAARYRLSTIKKEIFFI